MVKRFLCKEEVSNLPVSILNYFTEWQKRNTLAVVGFFGLALMYSLRFNLSIGIVAMVDDGPLVVLKSNDSDLQNSTSSINRIKSEKDNICPALIQIDNSTSSDTLEGGRKYASQGNNDNFPKFRWNEKEQGLVLGSFFWGYILSQFPGGLIAQRYGAKWVVSIGLLVTGILSLILPFAATYGGMGFVLLVRVLQGISEVSI